MNFILGFKDPLRFGTPGLREVMLNLVSVGLVLITILHRLVHAPAVQNAGPPAEVIVAMAMKDWAGSNKRLASWNSSYNAGKEILL